MPKTCRDCKSDFATPAGFFSADKSKADGLMLRCKACMADRWSVYYARNRAKLVQRSSQQVTHRRQANPEYDRRLSREAMRRKLSDPAAYAEHLRRGREWLRDNPDKAKLLKHNQPAMKAFRSQLRYARKRSATPPWADLDAIAEFYIEAARRSAETGVPHEVDHIIPLAGRNVCGLHVPHNLQVIPAVVNRAKGTKINPLSALAIAG